MKKCFVCDEEFGNQYSFCPIDGSSLINYKNQPGREYRPTLIDDRLLSERLWREVSFTVSQLRQSWPLFKAEPFAFAKRQILGFVRPARGRPYALPGVLTAAVVLIAVILSFGLFDRKFSKDAKTEAADEQEMVVAIDLRTDAQEDAKPGMGVQDKGRVG